MQALDKLSNVRTHRIPGCLVVAADFLGDAWLVVPLLHQLEDFGSDDIQTKHLAVMDVEKNSPVHRLRSPDCVRYSEHGGRIPLGILWDHLTCKELSHLRRKNSRN